MTLLADGGRLRLEVTAEVPVATYPAGTGPGAGVDLGIIHPCAVAGPDGRSEPSVRVAERSWTAAVRGSGRQCRL
ncbi:hypothetical protein [Dactylosporangium sp. CA-233914]|uniref:hypothetical protein n=1 Tax=Dactylosporangium sp. CA-233914 TaxID=3239934 RepID=UPI003D92FF7D